MLCSTFFIYGKWDVCKRKMSRIITVPMFKEKTQSDKISTGAEYFYCLFISSLVSVQHSPKYKYMFFIYLIYVYYTTVFLLYDKTVRVSSIKALFIFFTQRNINILAHKLCLFVTSLHCKLLQTGKGIYQYARRHKSMRTFNTYCAWQAQFN